jgi:hypothetical protein
MASVSIGQAEHERYPAWSQDLITYPLVGPMDFLTSHFEIDQPILPSGGYVYPILTSGRQGELANHPSTMMTDTVTCSNSRARISYQPGHCANSIAPKYLLPMEEDPSDSQRHFLNLPESPTWSTAELESNVCQALSFPSQSL